MNISILPFLIVCPMVFLAGLVDAIGGGGGLISLPAYLIAGIPTHMAIATNKLSSACGTCVATGKFILNKKVNFLLTLPTVILAFCGSFIGARFSLITDEKVLKYVLIPVLIVAAVIVLNRKLFSDDNACDEINKRVFIVASIASFVIGLYDGFYGPGTGTFLIIAMTVFGRLSSRKANAQAKVINLTTNVTSLVVFMMSGQVVWKLGIIAALCNMAGGYIGSSLALSRGEKIIRPVIICVLLLLSVKILGGF